ncbi:MAG TPA: protein translocase subunit SecD [Phycisphaerae bacterium]|nr:protein translocase subunit SecD [Phycisphaerae bacterium]
MNAKNLPLKFAGAGIVTILCLWSLYTKGCQQGIDLQGGHSLIFEIRTPQQEAEGLEADKERLKKELAQATAAKNEAEVKSLQDRIGKIDEDIQRKQTAGSGSDLSDRMISILKERIDPQGLANLEWRPIGSNRIEVRMPAGREDTRQKRGAYDDAVGALEAGNVSATQRNAYLYGTPAQREQMLRQFADPNTAPRLTARQIECLQGLDVAFDAEEKARQALAAAKAGGDAQAIKQAEAAYDSARAAFRDQDLQLRETAIRASRLTSILANYRTPEEEASLKDKELEEMRSQLKVDLAALDVEHPDRVAQVHAVADAYKAWAKVRHRLSDPSDLIRRVRRAGVLEFRIVAGYQGESIDRKDIDHYEGLLRKDGPEEVRRRGLPFGWFSVREQERKFLGGLATQEYAGRTYVLLSNRPGYRMVRERLVGGWRLTEAFPDSDQYGRPSIGFQFDEAGAREFSILTSTHVNKRMAILLDDEVFSAPTIQSAISDRGQITGRFTRGEVEEYVRLLEAGSLPARLNPEPVAVRSFGPTLGAENRKQGMRAAYMGMICVAAFMLLYYRVPGLIADVALVLNIVLVLGTMSLLNAVFTLPGIAGVVLTIGIAVDANVLIFERLREEQAKGQSVRMALKNAYERAFSAIFDANITTLITCLILGWVGTIEVRGFAITLGLGVVFSLFTALIVTRWIFQLLLDAKVVRQPLKMASFIGTPSVDWMGKRKHFWVLSAALMVLGLASVITQGSNIWGIEFSSGTQAVIQLRDDALLGAGKQLPNDQLVRQRFDAEAATLGYSSLRDSRVEMLLEPDKADNFLDKYDADKDGKVTAAEARAARLNEAFFAKMDTNGDKVLESGELDNLPATRYQLSTTEITGSLIQEVVGKAFGKDLAQRTECSFEPAAGQDIRELGLTCDDEGKARVEPNPDSPRRAMLEEFAGGVAVVVGKVTPPIAPADLKERIREIRSEEAGGVEMRRTEVIGLGPPIEDGYGSFAVLVKLDELVPARWAAAAGKQAELVGEALRRKESLVMMVFDPAIASLGAQRAIIAIVLSWVAIVLYLWLRFGSIQWGLAAVICLVHDVVIAVGLVAASGWLYNSFLGPMLGLGWFKIDLAMVAALLTVIGYSVNDTIVVFDRIRENRGKLTTISVPVINKSINQTLSRTVLTSGTTFIVVFIMYVWGGQGIHAFNFALLIGVIFGTYSSVAIASPLLLGFRRALLAKAAEAAPA